MISQSIITIKQMIKTPTGKAVILYTCVHVKRTSNAQRYYELVSAFQCCETEMSTPKPWRKFQSKPLTNSTDQEGHNRVRFRITEGLAEIAKAAQVR